MILNIYIKLHLNTPIHCNCKFHNIIFLFIIIKKNQLFVVINIIPHVLSIEFKTEYSFKKIKHHV